MKRFVILIGCILLMAGWCRGEKIPKMEQEWDALKDLLSHASIKKGKLTQQRIWFIGKNDLKIDILRNDGGDKISKQFRKINESYRQYYIEGSLQGAPTLELKGLSYKSTVEFIKGHKQVIDGCITSGDFRVLLPKYLITVSQNTGTKNIKTPEKDWSDCRQFAADIVDRFRKAGLLDGPKTAQGSFVVSLKAVNPTGDVMAACGVGCRVVDKVNDKTYTLVTDRYGEAKCVIDLPDAEQGLSLNVESLSLSDKSTYGKHPSYLLNPIVIPVNEIRTLDRKNKLVGKFIHQIKIRPLFVKAVIGTGSDAKPAHPAISIKRNHLNGTQICKVPATIIDAEGRGTIYLPLREHLGCQNMTVVGSMKIKSGEAYIGWTQVLPPGEGDQSGFALLEMLPGDLQAQLDRCWRKLEIMLDNAGIPQNEVKRILAIKFSPTGKFSYKDGVITIPPTTTVKDNGESISHELGHAITDVIAQDEPEGVGSAHEGPGACHPNKAWDEGRAHFWASVLTQEFELPPAGIGESEVDPKTVKNSHQWQNLIHRALVQHYGDRKFYPSREAVVKDFYTIHKEGIRVNGHPPRDIREFMNLKEKAGNAAMQQAMNKMNQDFGFK